MKLLKYFTAKKRKTRLPHQPTNIAVKYYDSKSTPIDAGERQHQVHITGGFSKNFVAN